MYEVKKYLKIVNESNLSSEEFNLLYSLFRSKDSDEIYEEFLKYWKLNFNKYNYANIIAKLEEQEFILNLNKKGELNINKIQPLQKFTDLIIVDIDSAYEQALSCYPMYLNIDNKKRLAKGGNHERLKQYYYDIITKGGDKVLHERFKCLTKLYHTNNIYAERNWENWLNSFNYIAKDIEEDIANDKYRDAINNL